jgi:3-hydroxy-9,10-secoandrosta-1,3,5(10)-triene-9,17-dione monooxygenase reductase component
MPTQTAFDPLEFRKTLGSFATGVTVITTCTGDNRPVGVTANSFNSVSMDPPLVLWSLAKTSRSLAAFDSATHWAVHILSVNQDTLSNRFAKAGEDKFNGMEIQNGLAGIPLLKDCSARLQCKTTFKYEGGDHIIFVGEVVDFERSNAAPLVYHGGKYAVATHKSPKLSLVGESQGSQSTDFDEDFLGYLLGRAQFDFELRVKKQIQQYKVSDVERYILFALTACASRKVHELVDLLLLTGNEVTTVVISSMSESNLLDIKGSGLDAVCTLTHGGRELALNLIGASKAVESEVVDLYGDSNTASLKNLLKHLIAKMDSGVPHPWEAAKGMK